MRARLEHPDTTGNVTLTFEPGLLAAVACWLTLIAFDMAPPTGHTSRGDLGV